jgi:hypothetical protein
MRTGLLCSGFVSVTFRIFSNLLGVNKVVTKEQKKNGGNWCVSSTKLFQFVETKVQFQRHRLKRKKNIVQLQNVHCTSTREDLLMYRMQKGWQIRQIAFLP